MNVKNTCNSCSEQTPPADTFLEKRDKKLFEGNEVKNNHLPYFHSPVIIILLKFFQAIELLR